MPNKSKYTIMTPSEAVKQNKREASGGNSEYMSFIGDPRYPSEYFSPEELDASVIKAFKSKEEEGAFKREWLEKQAATMMNAYDWKRPLATRGPDQGDKSLQNIAVGAIGLPLLVANPVTTTMASELLKGVGHAAKVMMNPTSAETTLGALTATGTDAYLTTKGLERNSQLIDDWKSGKFHHSNIPEFTLNILGAVPFVSTSAKAVDRSFDFINSINKARQSAKAISKPMTQGDPGLAQDYINAAGNAMEPVQVNSRVADIYNQQISGKLASENPSKLTEAERLGIPRGERKNVVRIQNPIVNDVLNNHKYGTINPDELIETIATESSLGSYSNDPIKKFVSTLAVDTHPAFKSITKDGKLFEHPTVTEFRNYLNNNGVDASVYSTDELSKLLTYEFLDKTKTATGALKDMILWHATDGNFNTFDFMTHLGKNTRNRGLYGMGNYFSTEFPQQYGINAQPFIISGVNDLKHYSQIKSWRNMPIFKDKVVPKGLAVLGSNSGPYVKTTFRPYMNYEGIAPYEIVVPKNHDIKSLFPHPNRFIQQPDGSVILKPTDWNDPRFNFKNGGKL